MLRSDIAIFGLPPVHNGKVGRPRKYGQQLTLRELAYERIGDYYQFSGNLMTRLFDMPVEIIVTVKDIDAFDSVRMFISTVPSHWDLQQLLDQQIQEKTGSNALILYEHRWDIEIIFYELKFFWSFGNYMIRTENSMQRYMNLVALAFTWVSILPFMVGSLKPLRFLSPQENKGRFAQLLTEELILHSFASWLENTKIYSIVKRAIAYFISKSHVA